MKDYDIHLRYDIQFRFFLGVDKEFEDYIGNGKGEDCILEGPLVLPSDSSNPGLQKMKNCNIHPNLFNNERLHLRKILCQFTQRK